MGATGAIWISLDQDSSYSGSEVDPFHRVSTMFMTVELLEGGRRFLCMDACGQKNYLSVSVALRRIS